jgi:hypothetical protein
MDEQTVQAAHTVFTSQLSYTFEDWKGRASWNVIERQKPLADAKSQIASSFKNSYWRPSSFILRALRKPNPKGVGRNVSVKTYGSCAATTADKCYCFSPIRSERSSSDMFPYPVGDPPPWERKKFINNKNEK